MSGIQKPEEYYRQCPGHKYKISDAVCHARQLRNFPLCKECQFYEQLDKKPKFKGDKVKMKAEILDAIFKAYDIRGIYPDQLNEETAWCIGHATAQFFRSQMTSYDRTDPQRNVIVVGRDMRESSPSLSQALIDGILSAGMNCINIGMIDTPQIYFAVNHLSTAGGVQVTASHNPAQYNGFKITAERGKPVGKDTGLLEIKRITKAIPPRSSTPQAELTEKDLSEEYKNFIHSFLDKPIRPLKIVVDASNGMAGKFWPIIFDNIDGIETIPINFEHTGQFVHDPNPLVPENLKQCQEAVKKHHADFGICFDGDADRSMLVDENGQIIPCDLLTALLAKYFLKKYPNSTIVYDLRSSWVVKEEIEANGGKPRRERVGHAFMKKAMAEENAIFGGELSGHFYFKDNWFCDSAFLAVVHILNLLTEEKNKTISELIKPLRRYFASGEQNFECEDKDERIKALSEKYKDAKSIDFLDGITIEYEDWWFNVRKSNTEPLLRLNLEAKSKKLLKEKLEELAPQLGKPVKH